MEYADTSVSVRLSYCIQVTYQWHQHTDITQKYWYIQAIDLIEHKVQLDVFQMSLLLLLSIIDQTEAVQDECHQLDMLDSSINQQWKQINVTCW